MRGAPSSLALDATRARRRGAWFGLAVGDALGAPVEFQSAAAIAQLHGRVTEMVGGGLWKKGEFTDDTELALCLVQAYAQTEFTSDPAAQAMLRWLATGPTDIGNQTRAALELMRQGYPPLEAGAEVLRANPSAAGNGSLMRAAPTGLVRRPEDPRLVSESYELSRLTHANHDCCEACVGFNAVLAALVFDDASRSAALQAGLSALRDVQGRVAELMRGVIRYQPPRYADEGIGYVLLCLERGLTALRDAANFEDGLSEVIAMGGDTDTNAAVSGALLGAHYGFEAIPQRWYQALVGKDRLEEALGVLERVTC